MQKNNNALRQSVDLIDASVLREALAQ